MADQKTKPTATDAAQKLADDSSLDLSTVTGTGQDGQITKPDVEKALAARDAGEQIGGRAAKLADVLTPPDTAAPTTSPVPAESPTLTPDPTPLGAPADFRPDAATVVETEEDVALVERRGPDVLHTADTDVSPVLRSMTVAATVGPKTDLLYTTRLDIDGDEPEVGVDQDTTASGDLLDVYTPNSDFAGVRGGVSFAGGRGLATAEQAQRLVREFGYRCPALSA